MAGERQDEHWNVEELIPHRGRMKLVGSLEAQGEGWAETRSEVGQSWPLCTGSAVDAVMLVELIAQSASLLIGWQRRHIEPQGGTGMLVGVREASFSCEQVPLDAVLRTRIDILRSFGSYVVFHGTVRQGEQVLCQAEIQAFRPDELRP